jgi:hypothetical protein
MAKGKPPDVVLPEAAAGTGTAERGAPTRTPEGPTPSPAPAPSEAAASTWNQGAERLLMDWHRRVAAAEDAHFRLAERLEKAHTSLGLPVVILTTFVGTGVFATLKSSGDYGFRLAVGIVSVLAAIVAGIQTFLRFSQRAMKHRSAATRYSAMRREIAETLALPPEARGNARQILAGLRDRMDKLSDQAPEIGPRLWASVSRKFGIDDRQVPAGATIDPGSSGTPAS